MVENLEHIVHSLASSGAPATLPEEEFTCPLCAKLLFEPVTTSCGAPFLHTIVQINQTLTKKSRTGFVQGTAFAEAVCSARWTT